MNLHNIILISCVRSRNKNVQSCMFSDVNRQVFNKNVIGLQFKGQKSARIGVRNLVVTFEEENAAICNFSEDDITVDCKPKTESNL